MYRKRVAEYIGKASELSSLCSNEKIEQEDKEVILASSELILALVELVLTPEEQNTELQEMEEYKWMYEELCS